MKSNKHLFYRKIEKNLGAFRKIENPKFVDCGWSAFMDVNENSKMSEILHSVFNFDAGDSCTWPCDNISKEEIDKLWSSGQRAFVFQFGYKEVILYDLRIITQKEIVQFYEDEKTNRANAISKIIELAKDWFDVTGEYNSSMPDLSTAIGKILDEYVVREDWQQNS
jgi:hypothetical protein